MCLTLENTENQLLAAFGELLPGNQYNTSTKSSTFGESPTFSQDSDTKHHYRPRRTLTDQCRRIGGAIQNAQLLRLFVTSVCVVFVRMSACILVLSELERNVVGCMGGHDPRQVVEYRDSCIVDNLLPKCTFRNRVERDFHDMKTNAKIRSGQMRIGRSVCSV